MHRLYHISVLLSLTLSLHAQRVTISGYVADAESGERMIGATVYDSIARLGTVTNNAGYFSLTLQRGQHSLLLNYVGYEPKQYNIDLHSDTIVNWQITSHLQLSEVTVTAHESLSGPKSTQMSVVEVPVSQIKGIPQLGGEVDVLKALQLLPGVQSGSEGSAGVYVRGGGPDENLILLDGVPLYNVNHAMGMFSVFNADAIKNVTLYKGNFPARFGSRLSSVIDVRQNDGNNNSYHGNLTIGLIAAKFNVEGPIWKGKTSFNISARRTYFDLFTVPLMYLLSQRETNGTGTAAAGYYFYDINAKVTHRFSLSDKLSASFYLGDDKIYVNYREREMQNVQNGTNRVGLTWNWGNLLGAMTWEHIFSARLFATTQLSFTRYRYDLKQSLYAKFQEKSNSPTFQVDESMTYKSHIMDLTLQQNYEWSPSAEHDIRFGALYTYHRFHPQVASLRMVGADFIKEGMAIDTTMSGNVINSHEATAYIEDTYTPIDRLKMNFGLHGSLYAVGGKVYPSLEPRVGLRVLATDDLAFKLSYAYMSQYIHLLSNASISLPTDLWVPVTKHIDPMRSMQVAAGMTYDIRGEVELTVEGYYKYMKNLLEYKDGATFMASAAGWEDKVCMGNGWSYGVELMLQRKIGKLTGWLSYTWSRTMRLFDREGQQLNFGRPFHAKYDREHDVSLTLMYTFNRRIDLSGTFVFSTGNRATLAMQQYYDPEYAGGQPIAGISPLPAGGQVVEIYQQRNNYVLPPYHRMDIGVNFHIPMRKWKGAEHLVNVSVYNLYNSMNPFLLYADASRGSLYKVTIFPILPSLSYSIRF